MQKRQTIFLVIFLCVSIILGSIITFVATNYVLGDVSNLFFGITNRPYYILATLPMLSLASIFTLFVIYILRYHRHVDGIRKLTRLYIYIFIGLSTVGLISSILAGTLVYHSFTTPNPFPGYLILMIIIFSIFIVSAIMFRIQAFPKMKEDVYIRRENFGYVLYTVLMCILVFYSMNRFGALLLSGMYVDIPTLKDTWPFYFSLILPLCMFIHTFLYTFNFYKTRSGVGVIVISIIFSLFILTTIYTYSAGIKDTSFISVISPAMGASRLLAKPVDFIFHTIMFGLFGLISFINTVWFYNQQRKLKAKA